MAPRRQALASPCAGTGYRRASKASVPCACRGGDDPAAVIPVPGVASLKVIWMRPKAGYGSNVPILLPVTGSLRGGRFRTSALTQPFQARHQPLSVSPVTLLQLGQNTVFHLARACPPRQLIALDLVPGLDVGQGRERVLQVGQEVVAIEPDVGFVGLSGHDSLPHELTRSCSCRELVVRYRTNPGGFRPFDGSRAAPLALHGRRQADAVPLLCGSASSSRANSRSRRPRSPSMP